jgi:hypothetical protein
MDDGLFIDQNNFFKSKLPYAKTHNLLVPGSFYFISFFAHFLNMIILCNYGYFAWQARGIFDIDENDFTLRLNGKKIKFDFAFTTVNGTPAMS